MTHWHSPPDAPAPRVLLTADPIGGVWTFALDLAREILAQGGAVAIASMGRALTPSQRSTVAALPRCTLFESAYRLEWMPDPWNDVDASGEWLLGIEHQWQPEVVHCNTLSHAALPWQAPVVLTVHSCVYSWYQAVKGQRPPEAEWREYFERVSQALKAADCVTAPTRALKEVIESIYPVAADRIEVVWNGRHTESFNGAGEKQQRLLAAGRLWDEAKNTALLARIAPRLDWPLRLAGDPGDGQAGEGLELLGSLPPFTMTSEFADDAIFLHPALYEPFGLTPLEAGLSRCALVLSDIPSLREIWGDAALFVNPRDEEGWFRTISWLIADTDRWKNYGRRARDHAQQFTATRMAEAYLGIYARIRPAAAAPAHQPTYS